MLDISETGRPLCWSPTLNSVTMDVHSHSAAYFLNTGAVFLPSSHFPLSSAFFVTMPQLIIINTVVCNFRVAGMLPSPPTDRTHKDRIIYTSSGCSATAAQSHTSGHPKTFCL